MKVNTTQIIGPRNCKFTLNGENLAEMRRTRINKVANALQITPGDSKNETLTAVIRKLSALGADSELAGTKLGNMI